MLSRIKAYLSGDRKFILSIRNLIGFFPGNHSVYQLAFLHRSRAQEHVSGTKLSNERLEYLGDAVLGAIVAELLFKKFPYREEGFLTEMRSRIVNRENLNRLAMKLGVNHFMDGSIDPNAKNRSAYGDAFEALIGAIYIDKGYEVTRHVVLNRFIRHHVDLEDLETQESNFKSKLLNWAQRERKSVSFELIEEVENGGGKKLLRVCVKIDDQEVAQAEDFSKKRAEQVAAKLACEGLGLLNDNI